MDRRNQLAGINLNLFPVLGAMLRHRSVTRAAQELGVTPSAVSHALRELRALLDDPLFVRAGTGMLPTRRATEVEVALREGLGLLGEVVQRREEFDPAATRRVFTVATSDEVIMATLPRVFSRLQREAPDMAINIRPRSTQSIEMLEVGELDLLLRLTDDVPSWAAHTPLDAGDVVCVVRGDHPRVKARLTAERFRSLPHIRVSPQGFGESTTERRLRELGIERKISIYTFSFATAAEFVAQTDAILTLPEGVAHAVAPRLGLRILTPPFTVPGFVLDMIWNQRRDDPALAWLRQVLIDAAADVRASYGIRR
ncbi:MAG: LysR family transcriptional regulator [Nannocystaceae bacterium]